MFSSLDFLIPLPAFDAVPLELFLPLDFFLGQLRRWKLELPDKAKVDLHLLHPVAINALRGVDDDFLNKLIDHGRGQLRKIGVSPCQLQKLLHTGGVLCESGQPSSDGAPEDEALEEALTEERTLELESELEQDEHPRDYHAELEDEEEEAAPTSEKRLKREIRAEALKRLEEAARTESDILEVVDELNKLDRNR